MVDNASFYHSELIAQMCADAGVKLVYLPPYLPDLYPIEEYFAELKSFIGRHWSHYENDPSKDLTSSLNGLLAQKKRVPRFFSSCRLGNQSFRRLGPARFCFTAVQIYVSQVEDNERIIVILEAV